MDVASVLLITPVFVQLFIAANGISIVGNTQAM